MNVDTMKLSRKIKEIFSCDDLLEKKFEAGGCRFCLMYIDAMTDKAELEESVVEKLIKADSFGKPYERSLNDILAYSEKPAAKQTPEEAAQAIAEGDIALLIEGADAIYIISLRKFATRAVTEPPTSSILKGPREGFIEDIKTNVTLLRRRLRTPDLKIKQLKIGRYSNTYVYVAYLESVADENVVSKVTERLKKVDIDGVADSSYLVNYLEERKFSLFDQIGSTEKPDILAAKMLEGRVGIIVDGSPIALTVPFVLFEHFQDSYDYFASNMRATFLRFIRLFGAFFTIMLPAVYVAMQEFHYHLLPLSFLVSIRNAIEGIPFTPPMEMLVVLLLFEVLHQASIRMPKYLGTALSIVGAIVLGETAVSAGLISSPSVLIIALSAIGVNCVPDDIGAMSTMRAAYLLVASVLGLYGMIIGAITLIVYLATNTSYGAPYLAPFAPIVGKDLKDTFFKANLVDMKERPYSFPNNNRHRSGGK